MTVRTEKDGVVWTVIHSRFNEARNAMDPDSADALVEQLLAFDRDPDARVGVLWGEGGAFCAGWDLKYATASIAMSCAAWRFRSAPILRLGGRLGLRGSNCPSP